MTGKEAIIHYLGTHNSFCVNATMFDRYLPFSCPLRYFRY